MAASTVEKMGRPKKDEPTAQLRLPLSTIRRIRRLASHFGKDASDYAAELLGGPLDKDESKMIADIARERKAGAE
jgi:predicted DNA-binding protein